MRSGFGNFQSQSIVCQPIGHHHPVTIRDLGIGLVTQIPTRDSWSVPNHRVASNLVAIKTSEELDLQILLVHDKDDRWILPGGKL